MGKYDIALRVIFKLLPQGVIEGLLPPETEITYVSWCDTQFAARERRADYALKVKADKEDLLLHIEFQTRPDSDIGIRILDYHSQLAISEYGIAPKNPTPIKSLVILLSGPKDPGPLDCEYRTSWKKEPFSGVRYTVIPVYLMTLEELEKKAGAIWLPFAPLTADAEKSKIEELFKRARKRLDNEAAFIEIVAAMNSIGSVNKKSRAITNYIVNWVGKEIVMNSTISQELYDFFYKEKVEKDKAKARKEGREEGREEVRKQAREREEQERQKAKEREKQIKEQEKQKAKEREKQIKQEVKERERKELERLYNLFSMRFEKSLNKKEKKLITVHLELSGPDEVYSALVKYDNKELLREWLTTFK